MIYRSYEFDNKYKVGLYKVYKDGNKKKKS